MDIVTEKHTGAKMFIRDDSGVVIDRAAGVRLWDTDGKEYIDCSSGAVAVISVGHGRTEVTEAMTKQARRFSYIHSAQFRHEVGEELAQELAAFAPGGLNRSVFVTGGSEGIESAVKMARQFHLINGRPDKSAVLARRRSFHGSSIAALSLSGIEARRTPFAPYLLDVPRVAEAYCYRCPFDAVFPGCGLACATDLERVIEEIGAERISAFIAEPIVAAAGAAMTPPPGYFQRVREICSRHDIVFIADEIVTAMGRTGRNFGIEHWDVTPDIAVTAKGLSGGYAPLGAVLVDDEIAEAFDATPFNHGFTFDAHPISCAAGLAVLRIIRREGLVDNAAVQGRRLLGHLQEIAARRTIVGDARGVGLLTGVELVRDGAGTPFDPAESVTKRVYDACRRLGLVIYMGAGAEAGASDQVLLTPPLSVSSADVDVIAERFDLALAEVERTL